MLNPGTIKKHKMSKHATCMQKARCVNNIIIFAILYDQIIGGFGSVVQCTFLNITHMQRLTVLCAHAGTR